MADTFYLVPLEREDDGQEEEYGNEDPLIVDCIFCDETVFIEKLDDHENISRRAGKCYE